MIRNSAILGTTVFLWMGWGFWDWQRLKAIATNISVGDKIKSWWGVWTRSSSAPCCTENSAFIELLVSCNWNNLDERLFASSRKTRDLCSHLLRGALPVVPARRRSVVGLYEHNTGYWMVSLSRAIEDVDELRVCVAQGRLRPRHFHSLSAGEQLLDTCTSQRWAEHDYRLAITIAYCCDCRWCLVQLQMQ